jgi:tetratricopeptide (TPR) repeat protein
MAKIPLRAYVKDIENLIERGEIEQAIAHAKNILKSHPKHIETYRLMGKSYLESQRYSEAADILQRVLSVIPDDFVSQIGMSIIREDEGNMDAAIWHMERAYEVQPFNPAVQDELRRLYGRRDGIEPPKIRLTRGALVRMYARGELYPQAIAETRAALAEDPQRLDLMVLLARLYYLSNQKVEAAEMSSTLISKLPYCLEANQILTEILPSTSRAEDAKKFSQRLYALDPYAAFLSPTAVTPDQVPDQAVMVEQFIWDSSMQGAQTPEWTRNIGIQWEESEAEDLPDWINTLKPESTPEHPPTAPWLPEGEPLVDEKQPESENQPTTNDSLIPDWMQDAGWITSDRPADEIMASSENEVEENAAPADIPDWLQSIAPPEASGDSQEEDRSEWLESIIPAQSGTNGKDNIAAAAGLPVEEKDDDLTLPDWLTAVDSTESSQNIITGMTDESAETPASFDLEGLPDWAQLEDDSDTAQAQDTSAVPDWLTSFDTDDSDAEEEPAKKTPDWIDLAKAEIEAEESNDSQPQPEVLEPAAEIPSPEASFPDLSDMDAAMAWLEGLAAKQGADEDTLMTPPDQRLENPPDWIQQESDLESTAEALSKPDVVEPVEPAIDDVPVWLQGVSEPKPLDDTEEEVPDWLFDGSSVISSDPVENDLPDWLSGSDSSDAPQEKMSEFLSETSSDEALADDLLPTSIDDNLLSLDPSDTEAAMAWLEGLSTGQSVTEDESQSTPEDSQEISPELALDQIDEEPAADQVRSEWLEDTAPIRVRSTEVGTEPEALPQPEETQPQAAQETSLQQTENDPAEDKPLSETELPDFSDMEAAMAWLEGLAAKQGADEATLITPPEQRLEAPPDWVQKEVQTEEFKAADGMVLAQEEALIPDWLEDAIGEETEAEPPVVEAESQIVDNPQEEIEQQAAVEPEIEASYEPTNAVVQSEIETPSAEVAAAESYETEQPVADTEMDFDSAFSWLESLAAKQGADEETLITSPEERQEAVPEWIQQQSEIQSTLDGEDGGADKISVEGTPSAEDESGLPAWLNAVETEQANEIPVSEESIPDWLKTIEEDSPAQTEVEQWGSGYSESSSEEFILIDDGETLPDWLQQTDSVDDSSADAVPEWIIDIAGDENDGEGFPSDNLAPDISAAWELELETSQGTGDTEESPTISTDTPAAISELQNALNRGDLQEAVQGYNQLIHRSEHLEEIIRDLRDALYRYPVDIDVWQALGDAYAQNNQLQEALDAYTKAEELLR